MLVGIFSQTLFLGHRFCEDIRAGQSCSTFLQRVQKVAVIQADTTSNSCGLKHRQNDDERYKCMIVKSFVGCRDIQSLCLRWVKTKNDLKIQITTYFIQLNCCICFFPERKLWYFLFLLQTFSLSYIDDFLFLYVRHLFGAHLFILIKCMFLKISNSHKSTSSH